MSILERAAAAPPSPAKGIFFAFVLAAPMWLLIALVWLVAGVRTAGVVLGLLGVLFLSAFAVSTRRRPASTARRRGR